MYPLTAGINEWSRILIEVQFIKVTFLFFQLIVTMVTPTVTSHQYVTKLSTQTAHGQMLNNSATMNRPVLLFLTKQTRLMFWKIYQVWLAFFVYVWYVHCKYQKGISNYDLSYYFLKIHSSPIIKYVLSVITSLNVVQPLFYFLSYDKSRIQNAPLRLTNK